MPRPMAQYVDDLLMAGLTWDQLYTACYLEAAWRGITTLSRPSQIRAHVRYRASQSDKWIIEQDGERVRMRLNEPPDTLGWRAWYFRDGLLHSPNRDTPWHTAELRAETWDDSGALRGLCGIHARRLPNNWLKTTWQYAGFSEGPMPVHNSFFGWFIDGVVERYGRYVLGRIGWRAEWVIIRKLRAPNTEVGLALEQVYPEVEVHYQED